MEHSFSESLSREGAELRRTLLVSVEAPWAEPLKREEVAAALPALERELENGGASNSEIRLWWIYAQAEHGGVPLAALTSPFEEICSELQESWRPLATAVGMTLLEKLLTRDQLRIAVIVCERCLGLASSAESPALTILLQEVYCFTLREELSRAEKRREKSATLEGLAAKLKEGERALEKMKRELRSGRKANGATNGALRQESKQSRGEAGAPLESFTKGGAESSRPISVGEPFFDPPTNLHSRSSEAPLRPSFGGQPQIIEVQFERITPREEREDFEAIPSEGDSSAGSEERASVSSNERSKHDPQRNRVRGFTRAGLLMVIAITVGWYFFQVPAEVAPEAMAMNTNELRRTEPEMVLPEMPRVVRPVAKSSSLDEVQKRLESLARRSREGGEKLSNGSGQSQQKASEKSDGAALQESDGASRSPSEEAPAYEPQYYDPKPRSPKLPELDSEKLAANVLESLDSVEGRLNQDRSPQAGVQQEIPLSGQALDGSPLKAYQVEQFSEPLVFKTIAPTNVLSAPSVLGSAIARLEVDAKVQVISRMGRWLEVRSTGGRRGYIYAQDAVISDEKNR